MKDILKQKQMAAYYKKIMIIDDDKVDRMALKKIVIGNGFAEEVMEADAGLEALDVLTAVDMQHDHFPELIFIDVNMPAMSGFQFLDVFLNLSHEYTRRCRIVMLCSVKNEKDRERSFNYYENVVGYYVKPVTEEILLKLKVQLRQTKAS